MWKIQNEEQLSKILTWNCVTVCVTNNYYKINVHLIIVVRSIAAIAQIIGIQIFLHKKRVVLKPFTCLLLQYIFSISN